MNLIHDNHIVSVKILNKNYNIKCPPEQAEALRESARIIEDKLREMKRASSSISTDRMLVVIALNLCHELLVLKNEKSNTIGTIEGKLQGLQSRIQSFLASEEELAVTA